MGVTWWLHLKANLEEAEDDDEDVKEVEVGTADNTENFLIINWNMILNLVH